MFVGHFAVGFAAKRAAPRLSLPLLFVAVAFLDILWPLFIVLGIEHARIVPGITEASPLDLYDYPWSHSLLTSLGWSVAVALPFAAKRRTREALVVAGCVFSHFVLDFVTHRPDLPLAPGTDGRYGLGLWNALVPAVLVEALLFAAGVYVYVRSTRATGRWGTIGLGAFVAVLALSWLSGVFGPPPPGIQVVAVTALVFMPITLAWAWAIDRARPVSAFSS
ncbi:MAG TPA: metal-dependent hydrolase [Polyangiaceae bacterium]